MKFSILQENLNSALSLVSHSVASRPQLPVLANILLAAEKGRIKVSATDLETSTTVWLGAKIVSEGAITVPAKTILEFISSLPKEKIEIEEEKNILKINCGSFRASFNGLAASEFPQIPLPLGKAAFILEAKIFNQAIGCTGFSAAVDESRPVLTGIKWEMKNNGLVLAATDGYRLSVKRITAKALPVSVKPASLILPARTLQEVARIVAEKEEPVKIWLEEKGNQVIFGLEDCQIATRLIDGEFPDFNKIIPEKKETSIVFDKEEFQKAVKIASIFARQSANIIKIKVEEKAIRISANAPEVGENESIVEAKVEGEEAEIAFNCRFLLDFLNSVQAEEVVLEMSGSLNPGAFKIPKDPSYLHIIMPIRLQS